MARGRMLNNKISTSLQFHNLPDDTCRLLATWTIAHLDKHGVFHGDPVIVKSYVFPRRADVTVKQVAQYLDILTSSTDGDGIPLVVLFRAKGETWQWWPQFSQNQAGLRPERESTSFPTPPAELPPNDGNDPATVRQDDGNTPTEEKGREVKVKEKGSKEKGFGADAPPDTPPPETSADYQEIRQAWITFFPDKPKPRAKNKTLQGKVKTRMQCDHFRDNWHAALERASESKFLKSEGFFDLAWFLKNDSHYEKCLNGNYDDRDTPQNKGSPAPEPKGFTAIRAMMEKEGMTDGQQS